MGFQIAIEGCWSGNRASRGQEMHCDESSTPVSLLIALLLPRDSALSVFAHASARTFPWVQAGAVSAQLSTASPAPRSSPPSSRAFSRLRTRITRAAHRRNAHVLITGIHSDWPPYYRVSLRDVNFAQSGHFSSESRQTHITARELA